MKPDTKSYFLNKEVRSGLLLFSAAVIFFLLLNLTFRLLQNEIVYNATLGRFSFNEHKINNEIRYIKEPFLEIVDSSLNHWDVANYKIIRDEYYIPVPEFKYLYAYYPLFPLMWRYSGLNARGICVLNFFLFIAGLVFLFSAYGRELNTREKLFLFLIILFLPANTVFLIPYTESLFYLTASLALWGLIRRRYYIWILFFTLATMTRRVSFLLVGASVAAALSLLFVHRNLKLFLKDLLILLFPVIIGTLAISVIQYLSGSGSFFTFARVQGMFNGNFGFPGQIRDWSHSSFPLNMAVLFLFLPLALYGFIQWFLKKPSVSSERVTSEAHLRDLTAILSVWYFAAVMLFIVFFQGGSINSTFRGIVCTPFFLVYLFWLRERIGAKLLINISLLLLFIAAVLIAIKIPYTDKSLPPRFTYLNFPVFLLFILSWLNSRKISEKVFSKLIILVISAIASVLLICHMFNTFLGDGWLFT